MRFILTAGVTETARIDGISAAGAAPELMAATPSADAELLAYGQPVRTGLIPVSPSGCPTPAVVTRAVRDRLGFDVTVLDAGLAEPTAAPTVDLDAAPGADIREAVAVPSAETIFEHARDVGRALSDDEIVVGETVPGGTTTALGVLTALGEPASVSSSLPENPLDRKRAVVEDALAASDIAPGDAAGSPLQAIRCVGDPVQAAVVGLARGALESGTKVVFAGGTQMVAAGALLRHADVDTPLSVATTSFVANDGTADVQAACERLDLELTVTDPGFDAADHVSMQRYAAGEAKEGVGMGGALALADREGVSMTAVRERIVDVYDALTEGVRAP